MPPAADPEPGWVQPLGILLGGPGSAQPLESWSTGTCDLSPNGQSQVFQASQAKPTPSLVWVAICMALSYQVCRHSQGPHRKANCKKGYTKQGTLVLSAAPSWTELSFEFRQQSLTP